MKDLELHPWVKHMKATHSFILRLLAEKVLFKASMQGSLIRKGLGAHRMLKELIAIGCSDSNLSGRSSNHFSFRKLHKNWKSSFASVFMF